jgi:hypothetical protein
MAEPLTVRLVPWVAASLLVLAGGPALLLLVAPLPWTPERVMALGVLLPVSAVLALVVWRRWAVLTVGERIVYRGRVAFSLPLAAALRIHVDRSLTPPRKPTTWLLIVEIQGREHRLPFAEHWLWGRRAQARAEALADRLGLLIADPVGEARRASRWRAVRWLGRGEEWKLALVALGLALGLAALVLAAVG